MTTVTITLDDDLERQVKQFAATSELSLEEAATELLQRNADLQRIRALRKKGRSYAQEAGIESETDLFETVREWRAEQRDDSHQ